MPPLYGPDPDSLSPEEREDLWEAFPEYGMHELFEYMAAHGTDAGYEPAPEPLDTSLSSTPGRGCMVDWFCRHQGGTGPGCERDCMFTRDAARERPNCFGFNGGMGILQPGDFLFRTLNLTCVECPHGWDCCEASEKLWMCEQCAQHEEAEDGTD